MFILLVLICIVGWGSFNSFTATKISGDSQHSSRVAVGQMAPNFTLQTVEGEEVALSDFSGQRIMINFWATWCPPCRAEMPDMQRFYKNHDVVVLAINGTNTEGSSEQVKQFVDDLGLSFPILLDEAGETYALYQIGPRPTSLFIDKSGMITHIHIGAMNVEMMIRQLKGMPEM
ncbi:thiol disulfide exchange role in cytochrome c biogenesis [Halalkalibacter okhensis]|uniref:Thiol disulfide exchange role in cytochrome c biogenesis n=1 Tax=Halalkalibacter okhensis TaxID=333138 RepID=A0A0B0IKV7_9BACI|nr:thiol disulfide exchange role in cytochrome c biogenesis [Halalkalibacter okhensis]